MIVQTHPIFWLLLVLLGVYSLRVHKHSFPTSMGIVYCFGLSLRLLPGVHVLYPGIDPWLELGSVHRIQERGFDLRGNYYHSGMPVLQLLLLGTSDLFGEYNAVVFLGPVLGWTMGFICLYKLSREFCDREASLVTLLVYSVGNVHLQSLTYPEQIALPIAMAVIYFFHRTIKTSYRDVLILIAIFMLLNITHHLTAFCTLVAMFVCVAFIRRFENRPNQICLWMTLLLMFVLYWQFYQEMLSDVFLGRTLLHIGEIPKPWPKPFWWWICYFAPKLATGCLVGFMAVKMIIHRTTIHKFEMSLISAGGAFMILMGLVLPRGLYPWRIFNQFFGYFTLGMSSLPELKRSMKILAAMFLIGIVAEFPITDMSGYYVGGYWWGHDDPEISAFRFLVADLSEGSRVVTDGRSAVLAQAFSIPYGKVSPIRDFEVYNSTSNIEAWHRCIQRHYDYIFVSRTYQTISQFGEISGAMKFSEEQLSKFTSPYFIRIFHSMSEAGTSEVVIYRVNTTLSA